jgi:hypothetical protein
MNRATGMPVVRRKPKQSFSPCTIHSSCTEIFGPMQLAEVVLMKDLRKVSSWRGKMLHRVIHGPSQSTRRWSMSGVEIDRGQKMASPATKPISKTVLSDYKRLSCTTEVGREGD